MENIINTKEIWCQFEALPNNAKQRVADFIASLTQGYRNLSNTKSPDFREEPFVGQWKDREDIKDSSSWVRELRTNEWRA